MDRPFDHVLCHSPFPHLDFYRFAAFFNSTEDANLNDAFPRLLFPDDATKRDEMARLAQEQVKLREKLNADNASQAKMKWQPWSLKWRRRSWCERSVVRESAGGSIEA